MFRDFGEDSEQDDEDYDERSEYDSRNFLKQRQSALTFSSNFHSAIENARMITNKSRMGNPYDSSSESFYGTMNFDCEINSLI